ncbi:TolC family protein [Opitutus sp. ER46]|uniref:TolC family protein n=1 Tax=Opitutus sp. ER46 TaxID=2161864 RepID=UPI000D31053F|nr:TolC family protein [Opitutus sp. ER46]PTY00654.1 TolC family protein [Opitutus sp. ER46]
MTAATLPRTLTFLAVFAPASLLAAPWTLERAVTTALEHSPDARVAQARIDAAQALVTQAQAAWLPQLSLSSRYTATNSSMPAFGSILNQRAFSFGLDFNHPGQIDNLNATGTLAYNLYSGGRASAGRHAARAGVEAASSDLQATRHQLAAAVVKAALNLQKAREAVVALEGGVRAYEAAVTVARARFEAGQLLKADFLSLEVQLAQTREALASARHSAALAARGFHFVLGLEPTEEPVEFVADDPALAQLSAPATADFSRRPELDAMQARVRAAEAMVTAARGGHRPTVNAFASYQYDQGWKLDRHADGWLAGLAVDVAVFDGGQTSGRVRQASAELAQAREMLRKLTLGISLEVEQARLAHADAVERRDVTAQAVAQAEESAALSRARFERESLLGADLIGAESRLLEARLRRTVALADERIALVDLRRALGLDPLGTSAAITTR